MYQNVIKGSKLREDLILQGSDALYPSTTLTTGTSVPEITTHVCDRHSNKDNVKVISSFFTLEC